MENSKTIETLKKYYSLVGLNRNPTSDEKEFVCKFELELAKALLSEFDNNMLCKLGKILLVETE